MVHALAVVGAQYGSEGKGAIVSKIAHRYSVHVRTGGPNAGHTIYHGGQKFVMQVIPCGWINPNATLIIGRGMLLDVDRFCRELEFIEAVDPTIRGRVFIDANAGILDQTFHREEGGVNGELHQRIGSTGEGVGVARVARISRNGDTFKLVRHELVGTELESMICENTPQLIHDLMKENKNVLLEGTQGSGLSLLHGPWPYVTSADTNAAQLAADAGIPPSFVRTLLVARTMPIRVAGNSGPMERETNWQELSGQLNKDVMETTTVTKKIRRIGYWEHEVVKNAVILNDPDGIALTFLDYIAEDERESFIREVVHSTGVSVLMTSVGGRPEDITELPGPQMMQTSFPFYLDAEPEKQEV